MKLRLVIAVFVIIAILLIASSAYIIYFSNGEDNNNNGNGNNGGNGNNNSNIDDEPPTIRVITRNAAGNIGDIITIQVTFSDNVEVIEATLFYRTEDTTNWISKDILSKSYDISLDSNENIFYYVTVDDAVGNGPIGDPSIDGSDYYIITVKEDTNGNNEYTRKVFIEESTATTCEFCPNAAEVIHKLFNPDDPEFYYISLVDNKNDLALDRVANQYNRFANPTVYLDGGFEVIYGFKEDTFKTDLKQKIKNSLLRDVPNLILQINAEWNESRKELAITVNIENKDSSAYSGELKVFICEIKSTKWKDYNGDAFHYPFLEYAIDQKISIKPDDNEEYTSIWNANKSKYSYVVPENLMAFAVIFNSEKNQGYSRPPDENPFDAYYADAVEAARVQEGTLPPTIGISSPKDSYRYHFNIFKYKPELRLTLAYIIRQRRNASTPLLNSTLIGETVLFGKGKIEVTVDAPAGVEKVEYYVDGELKYNTSEEPYLWKFSKIDRINLFFKKHTILVKVIDNQGRSAEDSIDIVTIFI